MDYGISYFVFLFLFVLEICRRSSIFRRIIRMPRAVFDSLNGVRQYAAIAIFVYSWLFIIRKQFGRYLIALIIGSFFHRSILFMIPIYWLVTLKYNKIHPMASLYFIHSAIFCKRLAASPTDVVFSAVCFIRGYEFRGRE